MKLLNFSVGESGPRLGVLLEGRILDVKRAYMQLKDFEPPSWFDSVDNVVRGGEDALGLLRKFVDALTNSERERLSLPLDSVTYHPPILRPEKVLNMSVNYASHGKETGRNNIYKEPFLFVKLPSCLIGHERPIVLPRSSSQVDYEGELAVVMGRRGKYVSASEAFKYVIGYTIMNDVSFRDRRIHPATPDFGLNWLQGKSLDSGSPVGPWLVTKDEIPDPHNLSLVTTVNGEVRQNDNTRNMIFKIPEIIEYASEDITLRPGDIISTGTPAGVGLGTGKYLRKGDLVSVKIEGIGELRNPVQ